MKLYKKHISDLGKIVTGKTPKTSTPENYGGAIPFLTPSDDLSGKNAPQTKKNLTEKGLQEVKNCLLPPRSICVSCIGSDLGKVVITNEFTVTNQQFNSIIPNEENDADFIYYLMTVIGKQLNFLSKTSTAVPIINKSTFSDFEIDVPSISDQKKIADVLSSIDDKIECNRRINENLEQQAQALFKSWFVDFEPFKDQPFVESELGMIPQGWEVESLSTIADYVNGLAMQKFRPEGDEKGLPVLKIKELGQGNVDDSSELCSPSLIGEKYIINDGDIIFSWSGTLMVKIWCGGKCGLNQHLFVVNPKDYPKWFVYHWTKYHLDNFIRIAKDKAVTMGHIKRGELDKAKTVIPDKENMQKVDALMKHIFEQMIANELESRRLAELRDALLPKLMSGELKVDEVNV
jgi:type I restriction enzyme S subunit